MLTKNVNTRQQKRKFNNFINEQPENSKFSQEALKNPCNKLQKSIKEETFEKFDAQENKLNSGKSSSLEGSTKETITVSGDDDLENMAIKISNDKNACDAIKNVCQVNQKEFQNTNNAHPTQKDVGAEQTGNSESRSDPQCCRVYANDILTYC